MKPDWEKLEKDFADSATAVVGDVDCTADKNKDLCSKYGVKGYPTIKYFTDSTAATGDSYEGGRTYADLKKWADENLGPSCSPKNIDLCDDDQKAEIEKYEAMDVADLQAMVDEKTAISEEAEKTFKDAVSKLQATYEALQKTKDEAIEAASKDMSIMRQVAAAADSTGEAADESRDEL